mmetsp:Transcript_38164/g.115418  ORF Transcript_38164/g.115418 Transcript_38164/m.115418 type:complete len:444 (+) Transcript_38164:732-2063(+)
MRLHHQLRPPVPRHELGHPRARPDLEKLWRADRVRHPHGLRRRPHAEPVDQAGGRGRRGDPHGRRVHPGRRPRAPQPQGHGPGAGGRQREAALRHRGRRQPEGRRGGPGRDAGHEVRVRGYQRAEDHRQRPAHHGQDLRVRHQLGGGPQGRRRGVRRGAVQRELHRSGEAAGQERRLCHVERRAVLADRRPVPAARDGDGLGEGPRALRVPDGNQRLRRDRHGGGLRRLAPQGRQPAGGRGGRRRVAQGRDPRAVQAEEEDADHQVHRPDVHDPRGARQRPGPRVLLGACAARGERRHGGFHRRHRGEGVRAVRLPADARLHPPGAQAREHEGPVVRPPPLQHAAARPPAARGVRGGAGGAAGGPQGLVRRHQHQRSPRPRRRGAPPGGHQPRREVRVPAGADAAEGQPLPDGRRVVHADVHQVERGGLRRAEVPADAPQRAP